MKIINQIQNITKGFKIRPGEVILINYWAEDHLEILDEFAISIANLGGVPIKSHISKTYLKDYYTRVTEEHLTLPNHFYDLVNDVDTIVDVIIDHPMIPHKDFPIDKISYFRDHMRQLFTRFMKKEKFIQVKVPTPELAQEHHLDFNSFEQAMLSAYQVNHEQLTQKANRILSKLQGGKHITITKENHQIVLDITNRPWHIDDGTGDIPCGEIYLAPIEESVNGEFLVPKIIFNSEIYDNTLFTIQNGQLVDCSSPRLLEFIKSQKDGGDMIGEFGIGLNDQVIDIIGYPTLDEKMNNTIHLAFGMNIMFGGTISTPFHLDLVFTPDQIEVDGEILYHDQKWI